MVKEKEEIQNKLIQKSNMNFGEALEAVKQGKMISRTHWKSMQFVFQRPEDKLSVEILINNVKSLPNSVKNYYKKVYKEGYTKSSNNSPFEITFYSYLCFIDPNNNIRNGWFPNQADLIAEDWEIVEE